MNKAKRPRTKKAQALDVKRVLDYYENQTDEEAAEEIASAPLVEEATWMRIPAPLVSQVKRLIARRKQSA